MNEETFKTFYNGARAVIVAALVLFFIFISAKCFGNIAETRYVYDVEPPDIESVARDHDREVHKEAGIERDEDGNGRV